MTLQEIDALALPDFLIRSKPTPGANMTEPKPKPPEDKTILEANAATLTSEIATLDEQANAIKTQRTAKHKELRGITSKLVTLKLKSK